MENAELRSVTRPYHTGQQSPVERVLIAPVTLTLDFWTRKSRNNRLRGSYCRWLH